MRPRSGVAVLFLVALIGAVHVGWGPDAAAAATCNTFDANNTPTTAFKGGDELVVRGTGFAANSVVLVDLQQGGKTTDLARVRANDLGAFALTNATIPADVTEGEAAIRAADARGSATCAVTLAPGDDAGGSLGGLFLVWGIVLAAFGGVLAALTYRRWKSDRLREAVDSLAWREQFEGRAEMAAVREPVAVSARARSEEAPSVMRSTDPLPPWSRDDEPTPSWVRTRDDRGDRERAINTPASSSTDGLRDEVSRAWARDDDQARATRDDDQARATRDDDQARATRDADAPSPWSRDAREDAPSPWEPSGAQRPDAPPSRVVSERRIPQPPMPTRPGAEIDWSRDDESHDDELLSAIGAPRPFDDRFGAEVRSSPPPTAPRREPVVARTNEPEDHPPPRPFAEDVSDDEQEAPVSPWTPQARREAEPPRAPERVREPLAEPPAPREPVAEPVRAQPPIPEPVRAQAPMSEPQAEPFRPEPQPPVPSRHQPASGPTTVAGGHEPVAPRSAAGAHERDFARALRDFLDEEDRDFDRRSGGSVTELRPVPPRPRDVPRMPERREPAAPAVPIAPSTAAHGRDEVPDIVAAPATEPAQPDEQAWAPPMADRGLQPGPMPAAPHRAGAEPAPSRPDEPPQAGLSRPVPAAPARPVPRAPERAVPRAPERIVPSAPERAVPSAPSAPAREVPRAPEPVARDVGGRRGAEPVAYDPTRAGVRPAEPRPEPPPTRWVDPDEPEAGRRPPPPMSPDMSVSEPPVLPVGWDEGRLKPPRTASDAITRLRREVRNWRDDRRT